MGLFRIIREAGEDPPERRTMHGSGPQRSMLKHGGQAMRWADVERKLSTTRGINGDEPRPRHSGERP